MRRARVGKTMSRLAGHSVPDAAYAAMHEQFSEKVVFLSVSIATINA